MEIDFPLSKIPANYIVATGLPLILEEALGLVTDMY